MGALQGDVASSGVRLRQQRLLASRGIGKRHATETQTRRDQARGHELAQQGSARGGRSVTHGTTGIHYRLEREVVASAAVETVGSAVADQDVISCAAAQNVVAAAADQDVISCAAAQNVVAAAADQD